MNRKMKYAMRLVDLGKLRQLETNTEALERIDAEMLKIQMKMVGVK